MDDFKLLKELSDGFSTQAKLATKYWFFLMFVSIISISHQHMENIKTVKLPLDLGEVSYLEFNSFMVLLVCATSIAFASSLFQSLRTRKLIQNVIDNTPHEKLFIENVHIQDIFDSIVTQNIHRVAPIAQFLQGENQFFGDKKPSKFIRYIGAITYFILKITSLVLLHLIPIYALITNFLLFTKLPHGNLWGLPFYFYWIIYLISLSIFLIMIVTDLKYLLKVIKRIAKPAAPVGCTPNGIKSE
ncbi:MAG: hypothetical protein NTX03_09660 [Bacteroidetes bacterium]|nr:hypothetical protein [Bacteroidota bacterium]